MPGIVKSKWRNTATRRMIRGALGPSKKTLERTRDGLMRQVAAQLITEYKGKGQPPEDVVVERVDQRARRLECKMSAKYALDAINVRDARKRKRIYEGFEMAIRLGDRAKQHGRDMQPVVANEIGAIVADELGAVKGAIFVKLCMRKWKRMRNYFQ